MDKGIGKRCSEAIAQDVPNYLKFDGQSYPTVADPTHVSTFSLVPLVEPKEETHPSVLASEISGLWGY